MQRSRNIVEKAQFDVQYPGLKCSIMQEDKWPKILTEPAELHATTRASSMTNRKCKALNMYAIK